MLANRREHPCTVIDASSAGIAIIGPEQAKIGETVIVYIDGIGRVEGEVVRHLDDDGGFAIKFRTPSRAAEALGRLTEQQRGLS